MNVLFITLDQFRADSLGASGCSLVTTPTLDRIAREGVRLTRHYSQAAPCSPGRAALYTGTYQMNNRVVANGTPLAEHFDNIARLARRAGYSPVLFGYTDQGIDPHSATGPDDPRLDEYDGVLPGFDVALRLPEDQGPWVNWLREHGFDVPLGWEHSLAGESERPAELSLSSFLTSEFLDWHSRQDSPWFAHLSYMRPHPPYAAAGHYSRRVDPADVELPIEPVPADARHPLHTSFLSRPVATAPREEEQIRHLRAQYYGMIDEVDANLARIVDALVASGQWNDTLVIVTSDHGDQLGDHGLIQKLGFFPQSYHILGLWRDPRQPAGRVITEFTENVDLMPSLAVALGLDIPRQCDGRPLQGLIDGSAREWRTAVHYEWDYRSWFIGDSTPSWPLDRKLSRDNLAVSFDGATAYVQFGDGSYLCFDTQTDPTWRTETRDTERAFAAARELLQWRQEHLQRDLTDMLLRGDRPGHWPEEVGGTFSRA